MFEPDQSNRKSTVPTFPLLRPPHPPIRLTRAPCEPASTLLALLLHATIMPLLGQGYQFPHGICPLHVSADGRQGMQAGIALIS